MDSLDILRRCCNSHSIDSSKETPPSRPPNTATLLTTCSPCTITKILPPIRSSCSSCCKPVICNNNWYSKLLNFPTESSLALLALGVAASAVENNKYMDYYGKYNKANTTESAEQYRIQYEKHCYGRNVAEAVTAISAGGLIFFIIRDYLWHPSIEKKENSKESRFFPKFNDIDLSLDKNSLNSMSAEIKLTF